MKLLLAALVVLVSLPTDAKLMIGDAAPPLGVKDWVKGGPIDFTAGRGKNIYVVEFWATWSEYCRNAIPAMTELQRKYKDRNVIVIGLTDEPADLVKTFADKMGAQMEYVIGIDEHEKAFKTYMTPFDQERMPYAFIIDKQGRLVWHGHPLGSLDKALEELTAGKFNLEAARKHDQLTKMQLEYVQLASAPGTREKAAELGNTIVAEMGKNISALNSFAWCILTDRRIRQRDKPLALKAAQRAYDLGGSKHATVLDTYARALFENGQKEAAIEQQKAAIALAKEEGTRIEYEGTLNKYQRLLRESRR